MGIHINMVAINTFKDKRKRTWEVFNDPYYYDTICVRLQGDRDFNSQTSFHFHSIEVADQFIECLKKSY